ncbi:hypothetical protein [Thalassolituus oleivorans]|uniref:hypothetical protein n=1 Tax=Thalassolituus oleivorans TaxID=187493 RepID=UPI002409A73B|nr:hypothetical protein [Thalassolituus oleivorans]MDF1639620.1 hypothetical protein [Thalassolituus oleivorans]
MKRSFDYFYLDVVDDGIAEIYSYGSKKGTKYKISLKPKNFVDRIFSTKETKGLPNIILRNGILYSKISILKRDGTYYLFRKSDSILAPVFPAKVDAWVSESNFTNTVNDIKNRNFRNP